MKKCRPVLILLIIMITGIALVPLVSAEDIHFVRDLSNVQKEKKIAQPLNESEMITILFSNGWLEKQNTGETKGIVNLTVNESKFKGNYSDKPKDPYIM
jgi:hypothetical protein